MKIKLMLTACFVLMGLLPASAQSVPVVGDNCTKEYSADGYVTFYGDVKSIDVAAEKIALYDVKLAEIVSNIELTKFTVTNQRTTYANTASDVDDFSPSQESFSIDYTIDFDFAPREKNIELIAAFSKEGLIANITNTMSLECQ